MQDEGSQLAALALTRALPVREGERWLDLCAAPGGKTAVLAAEALAHGALLEANELSPARAGLVRDSVAGVPLEVPVWCVHGTGDDIVPLSQSESYVAAATAAAAIAGTDRAAFVFMSVALLAVIATAAAIPAQRSEPQPAKTTRRTL